MTDILLAGQAGETFGGLANILTAKEEAFTKVDMDLTDPRFPETVGGDYPSVIIARFHEGDLASIKAMQSFRLRKTCSQFIFVAEKEISPSILTLMFNEGAFGILREPLSPDGAVLMVRQAIRRSKWDLEETARSQELFQINLSLQKRVDHLETALSRSREMTDKLERMVHQALADKLFKASRVKILLVMASEYQRNLLLEDIKGAGFTVEACKDASEALTLAKRLRPSIVVSDLELEGMSGVELAQAMKGDPAYPNVYFVVVTSTPERIEAILAPGGRVDDCLLKPTSPAGHYRLMARIALGALNS